MREPMTRKDVHKMHDTTYKRLKAHTRVLFLDLDGTLLNSDSYLSEPSRNALEAIMAKGIKVVIASARRWSRIKLCLGGLVTNAPVISSNGSVIIDPLTEKLIAVRLLEPSSVKQSIKYARRKRLCMMYYSDPRLDGYIYREMNPAESDDYGLKFINNEPAIMKYVADLSLLDVPAMKLLLIAPKPLEIAADLAEELPHNFIQTYSNKEPLVEILPSGCSKAFAAEEVVRNLGFHSREVAAFGDDHNDLEILRWAGFSVAMAHAPADVRNVADEIIEWNCGQGVESLLKSIWL
jgi:Cof subfamily protein (haloacid dehalogenase superfamily)